ncbi:MAG: HAMP domain-containing sensor histidine kinase [Candidatus Andersenbacteria bacterium]
MSLLLLYSLCLVVLRYGTINTAVTFSRHVVLATITSVVLITIIFWPKVGLSNQAEQNSSTTVFSQIIAGLFIVIVLQQLLNRFWGRQITRDYKQHEIQPNRKSFLQSLVEKYQLTGVVWVNRKIKAPLTEGSIAFNEITARLQEQAASTRFANPIDISKDYILGQHFRTITGTGPQRVSLALPALDGYFVLGHKKFNIAFTPLEVESIQKDIALYAAKTEVEQLQRTRKNHVAEVQLVTEQQTEQLHQANANLYKKLQDRTAFFKTVARELRTPLTVVLSGVQSGAIELPKEAQQSITESVAKLVSLSKEFEQSGGTEIVDAPLVEWIDIDMFLEKLHTRFAKLASRKSVSLTVKASPKCSQVSIKPLHLEEILDNLIENAIKYSIKNTQIDCSITVSPGRLLVKVTDQNQPISPDEQDLIFEPFYRTASSVTQKGTGLGLSIVRKLAKAYGGNAQIVIMEDGVEPQGNQFLVELHVSTRISV